MTDFFKLENNAPDYDLRDLLEAGCHFGHESSNWYPEMAEWIYGQQDGIHLFDLEKTAQQLALAYNYFYHLGKTGKKVIFVGTKRQAKELVKDKAGSRGIYWVTSRWLGGLITNWQQVGKSLRKMIEIEEGLKSNKYERYTKYEQTQLEKEAGRYARFFDGLRGMKAVPEAIFVVDPKKEQIAVTEAAMSGVKVIALVDSNTNPKGVDLVIPANDDGHSSIEFIVEQLTAAYEAGKTGKKAAPVVKKAKAIVPTAKKAEVVAEEKPKEEKTSAKADDSVKAKKIDKKETAKPAPKAAAKKETVVEPSMSMKRAELNDLASEVGVKNSDKLASKQAVIDAINNQTKES
jgi:small subunit ribosomal protein S2